MNKIKDYRYKAKLSQNELAQAVGLTTGAIGLYERGLREPSLKTIKKLAQALKCKPTDLFPVLKG
ncbi:hypothetical protein BKK54_03230 [Rodentibacter genomosp. 1]|uniref:HTH cro/C1-type domain-containing protein n=1 Tax=Rodentibacter genomosp. 1 TaxID=1908264 RepID=A0A1V3J8S0_9PAST|nr:helix-turn-helix transcriptional regulator [Rodentibacter genomosp. 1]OOF51437.1 hypothetical protein BKK54_03230 [Rodentibacter genomosp. 1]